MSKSTQLYANNATSTLASPISPTDLTIFVSAGTGSLYPSPDGVTSFFLVTIEAGGAVEIVKVISRTGDIFTIASGGRGGEGTSAASWSAGSTVECRITKNTLAAFARLQDRVAEVASVDSLTSPITSDANSYLCHSNDDNQQPVVAVRFSDQLWKFKSHPKLLVAGITGSATGTTVTSADIASKITNFATGKYLIQFTSGVNQGSCRTITSTTTNQVSWATAFSVPASLSDTFEIYQSEWSILVNADNAGQLTLIYSLIFSG